MRYPLVACVFVCLAVITLPLLGQSPNGNVNGLVADQTNAAVADADIVAVNDVTGVQYTTKTNTEGIYVLPNLPPGPYRVQVSKIGFKTLIKPDIILNVQDSLSINFTLLVGAFHEVVTVAGGAPLVDTQSAAVSTVVDGEYVENMPLNGRSFQDLILLTPGVITTTPQIGAQAGASGEFSVNGQRTEANYYTIDGVSGNIGLYPGSLYGAGAAGSVPAATALGTTQGLVSVDSLQEFRVQSSTYSAEYGRSPGGQFSFVTRSGTNQYHGTAFDYLRNNFFDANDWFNDYYHLPEPAERQNDFGGTFGGPVKIPHLYDGTNRTFLFFSYEGLRLTQPQAANITYVPDLTLRSEAPDLLGQALNAFPLPNGMEVGSGEAEFVGSWSNPSSIAAVAIRLDHSIGNKMKLFFRFSNSPSSSAIRSTYSASELDSTFIGTRTFTWGATNLFLSRLSNDLRINYSSSTGTSSSRLDGFGGASATDLAQLQGINTGSYSAYQASLALFFGSYPYPILNQGFYSSLQHQFNLVDTVTRLTGQHQLKFGIDYRHLSPLNRPQNPYVAYDFFSENSVLTNSVDFPYSEAEGAAYPLYINFSAFAQDAWRLSSRFTLSIGLRWEVNPAPGISQGLRPYTVTETSDLASMSLAPEGTSLWRTTWYNLAPRIGGAYVLHSSPNSMTVLRGGAGIFYDTGQQTGSEGFYGPGFFAYNYPTGRISFPDPSLAVPPSLVNPPSPPYGTVYAFVRNLQLPYTMQTNLSFEQGLGKSQALTLSYVGAFGRKLLKQDELDVAALNPNFSYLELFGNGLSSDYNALQAQFQRRMSAGLQTLASYTWSHCLDYGSENNFFPFIRGNCDYDLRHNFAVAVSYEIPASLRTGLGKSLLDHWALDTRANARTGFPVTLRGPSFFDPATNQEVYAGLNVVAGQPIYIYGAQCAALYDNALPCPGNRAINPLAFSPPAPGEYGDAGRNFVRGFGAWQIDLAIRRNFPLGDRLKLQFRGEAFNVFNHPNFGLINADYGTPQFGQATSTLARSLGGLSPLYQMGGPRSLQLALKLIF